jgi:hypothetical protein
LNQRLDSLFLDVVDAVHKRVAYSSEAVVVYLCLLVKDLTKLLNLLADFGNAFLMEALVNLPDVVEAVELVLDVMQPVDDITWLLSWHMLLVVSNVDVNVFCRLVSVKQYRRWCR